jgi:arginyl-tRNA synthetase
MPAAKKAGKNPREVAQSIIDALSKNPAFSKMDIAGPGFINLNITDEFLNAHLGVVAADERHGVPFAAKGETVMVDYGGANIAKAMHVGHLRAAIIGEAVKRTLKYAGYNALGDVHMGDWGTHMGMLIADYIREGEQDLVLKTDVNDEASVQRLMDDMAVRYPKASGAAKADEAVMKIAQETTVKLQNKEAPYYPIWQKIFDVSVEGMKKTYGLLDVHFEIWNGEAAVHDLIAPMVEGLKKQGFAVESEGAWVFHVVTDDDKKEVPPLILYKRDGAVMYGTTDLATLVDRMENNKPVKVVYVVDQRQALHFEQVFRAAYRSGIVPKNVELTHAGFGTMNGPDGKPFKTREGGVMKLEDLIAMATEKAVARMAEAHIAEDMNEIERASVANKVAVAAIKFADLQNQRQADYIFDLDRLTRFEGKTGPYLLYQAVRIKSLLRKAEEQGMAATSAQNFVLQDVDRPLALLLTELPDAIDGTLRTYAPHFLCEYAYKLAQAFSSFYGNCHIISEENAALRQSRLALCAQTYAQLETVLNLLGISIPERM